MGGFTYTIFAFHVVSEDPGEALTHIDHLCLAHLFLAVGLAVEGFNARGLKETKLQLAHFLVAAVRLLNWHFFSANSL